LGFGMRLGAKIILGLVTAFVLMFLFLLPWVSIPVEAANTSGNPAEGALQLGWASGSVMYAYFGVGAVQVPNPYAVGHTYCFMYGDPGTMCGFVMHRTNQMMFP